MNLDVGSHGGNSKGLREISKGGLHQLILDLILEILLDIGTVEIGIIGL
jgi:hypothetical protein